MVARAFSVLGDKEKRDKFDRFGTDPDSRFESARQQQQQNPFAGFANRQRAGGGGGGGFGGGFEDEISPEEMFRRFFGGGGFGGPFGGGFDTGPQFVFNMGGGPGIRVHQFGGGRPRRRPRDGADPQQQQQQAEASILSTIIGLLPVIFLFIIPLITSLFAGPTTPAVPDVVFDMPLGAHVHRQVHDSGLNFFVREEDWAKIRENKNKVSQLHQQAYVTFVNRLKSECEHESHQQRRLHEAAHGWFYVDQDMLDRARSHPKPSCARLERLLRKDGKPDVGRQQGKAKAS
ncbi:hypothetical protein MAPG_08450 [Magnaporthiopsis poae ATCC 64411]|uniref:DUF1977 domain-containing protein n=1 Tax=Magnaporthiopsis poae (strain ATCC 64411 / 73-15) TaxID=644358 RepID=A0A0C4E7D7_MAGP6|nr:hypothetical protein MAPG_08450 [Magnaporthiopsis poae ATCC 64411]